MILVAGSLASTPHAFGGGSLLLLVLLAMAGVALMGIGAILLRRHAPRACPTRRHDYAGNR